MPPTSLCHSFALSQSSTGERLLTAGRRWFDPSEDHHKNTHKIMIMGSRPKSKAGPSSFLMDYDWENAVLCALVSHLRTRFSSVIFHSPHLLTLADWLVGCCCCWVTLQNWVEIRCRFGDLFYRWKNTCAPAANLNEDARRSTPPPARSWFIWWPNGL